MQAAFSAPSRQNPQQSQPVRLRGLRMPRSAQVRTLSQSAHLRTTLLRSGAPERRPSATARCHANPSAVCLAEFIKAGPFCYADGPQLQADTMRAIHALADYLQKGAQLDI